MTNWGFGFFSHLEENVARFSLKKEPADIAAPRPAELVQMNNNAKAKTFTCWRLICLHLTFDHHIVTIPYYSRIKGIVTNFMILFLSCPTYELVPVVLSLSLSLMQHLDLQIFSDITLLAAYLQTDVLRFFFLWRVLLISGLDAGVWSVAQKPPCWCCGDDLRDFNASFFFLRQMKSRL